MENNQYSEKFSVIESDCISAIDSSLPDLLGTYIIVKWMEIVSAKNINQCLDDQHISVGERIDIEHHGMVKLGGTVEIISTIEFRKKRNVIFVVEAYSGSKLIAKAKHERVIIPTKLINRIVNRLS